MNYAVIESGVVMNLAEADAAFAKKQGWIAAPDGTAIGDLWDGSRFSKAPEKPVPVPQEVEMWQARAVLSDDDGADRIPEIDAYVASLPDEYRPAAKAKWEWAGKVRRDDSLVAALKPVLGYTDAKVDALFIRAAALT